MLYVVSRHIEHSFFLRKISKIKIMHILFDTLGNTLRVCEIGYYLVDTKPKWFGKHSDDFALKLKKITSISLSIFRVCFTFYEARKIYYNNFTKNTAYTKDSSTANFMIVNFCIIGFVISFDICRFVHQNIYQRNLRKLAKDSSEDEIEVSIKQPTSVIFKESILLIQIGCQIASFFLKNKMPRSFIPIALDLYCLHSLFKTEWVLLTRSINGYSLKYSSISNIFINLHFRVYQTTSNSSDDCPICLDPNSSNMSTYICSNHHIIHLTCLIETWKSKLKNLNCEILHDREHYDREHSMTPFIINNNNLPLCSMCRETPSDYSLSGIRKILDRFSRFAIDVIKK